MQWPPCEMSGMEDGSRGGACPCLPAGAQPQCRCWMVVCWTASPPHAAAVATLIPAVGTLVRAAGAASRLCADPQPLLRLVCSDEQRKKEYEERQAARKAREVAHKPAKYEQEVRGWPGCSGVVTCMGWGLRPQSVSRDCGMRRCAWCRSQHWWSCGSAWARGYQKRCLLAAIKQSLCGFSPSPLHSAALHLQQQQLMRLSFPDAPPAHPGRPCCVTGVPVRAGHLLPQTVCGC
jgi:hypothetical protein